MPNNYMNPFQTVDYSNLLDKISEPLGVPELDVIREFTLSSLCVDSPTARRGSLRAVHLLYSLGLGSILTHAFGFSDDRLMKLDCFSLEFPGKSLRRIADNNSAYTSMYNKYLGMYSKQPGANTDLIELSKIESTKPGLALPIAKLLLLLVASCKFEE